MEIGTGCPAAGTRRDVRHSLSGSSSGLQLCSWRGWLPHRPPPLSLLWAIAPPRRSWNAEHLLAPACGRACVCTPWRRHSPAWRLAARGDRVETETTAQTSCLRNHHHFRFQPQHRSSAALTPHHHHQAREGCAATGRRPCLVVLRVVCINDSWAKKRKNGPISNPRNNRFSPPCGGLGGKRRLPSGFCFL